MVEWPHRFWLILLDTDWLTSFDVARETKGFEWLSLKSEVQIQGSKLPENRKCWKRTWNRFRLKVGSMLLAVKKGILLDVCSIWTYLESKLTRTEKQFWEIEVLGFSIWSNWISYLVLKFESRLCFLRRWFSSEISLESNVLAWSRNLFRLRVGCSFESRLDSCCCWFGLMKSKLDSRCLESNLTGICDCLESISSVLLGVVWVEVASKAT